ncbi:LysR substrate-binding domain-containing protein [Spirillospora sp. NPDC048819]|uniref:LysR substrate-binding domain-containing protein n=1 Tax=Spirillospora sp. NPDC048819 TaxID=3155268 RepID=UPI0033F7C13B
MELRQLEYVLAVAEELHFGRAAARLHVTQQSVSEQVRRLERELGGPLFARTSRRVSLTTAGEAFLPEARRVVDAARHALDVGRRAARGATEIRVGYADDLGPRLFGLAVPRVPSLTVTPRPMTTPEQIAALSEHRLDLGLGWTPDVGAGLSSLLVAREPLVVALAEGHPLAGETALDPADLSHRPLAVVPRAVNPLLHDRIIGQLVTCGVTVNVHQEIPSLDRMLPLVLAGSALGITVPSAAAANAVAGVVYRHLSEPSPYIDCRLMWRAGDAGGAVAELVGVVRELRDSGAFLPPDLPGGA